MKLPAGPLPVKPPTVNPNDLLHGESPSPAQAGSAAPSPRPLKGKGEKASMLRFTNRLPAQQVVLVHQKSYWSRQNINDVLATALREYFQRLHEAGDEDAFKPLPEDVRLERGLPVYQPYTPAP